MDNLERIAVLEKAMSDNRVEVARLGDAVEGLEEKVTEIKHEVSDKLDSLDKKFDSVIQSIQTDRLQSKLEHKDYDIRIAALEKAHEDAKEKRKLEETHQDNVVGWKVLLFSSALGGVVTALADIVVHIFKHY